MGGKRGSDSLNLEGNQEIKYSQGLGKRMNNWAEMFGLLIGLHLAKERELSKIEIMGDSLLTIQHLQRGSLPNNNLLSILLQKILSILNSFTHKAFYHILRSENEEVDPQENQACLLDAGQIFINGMFGWNVIP